MKFLYRAHRPILFVILLTSLLLGGVSQAQFPPGFPRHLYRHCHPLSLIRACPGAGAHPPSCAHSGAGCIAHARRCHYGIACYHCDPYRRGDALAPYHPTAVGVYTRIERRPQEEWTLRNMNIATLYASYHAARGLFPHREAVWRSMLTDYGLDPADGMDLSTPAGIGTAAGKGAVAGRLLMA